MPRIIKEYTPEEADKLWGRKLKDTSLRGVSTPINPEIPRRRKKREWLVEFDDNGLPIGGGSQTIWSALENQPEILHSAIERRAAEIIKQGLDLTTPGLVGNGLSGFYAGINQHYPGGLEWLRINIGVEVLSPGRLVTIQQIEDTVYRLGRDNPSLRLDHPQDRAVLQEIRRNYPGGLKAVKTRLKIDLHIKETTSQEGVGRIKRDKMGRIDWATLKDDPIKLSLALEEEVREYIKSGGKLEVRIMESSGYAYLSVALKRFYPGGIKGVKEKIGIQVQKPVGFWKSPEQVQITKQEAENFFADKGAFTMELLRECGESNLLYRIQKHYPGSWRGMLRDLEIEAPQRVSGYWTKETVLEESRRVFIEYGMFSTKLLKEIDRLDLKVQLSRVYEGGIREVQQLLGIEIKNHPKEYWIPENIENEAMTFFDTYGGLTQLLMTENDRYDLIWAIRSYPGKLTGLKEKLGISRKKLSNKIEVPNIVISQEVVDDILAKLLSRD